MMDILTPITSHFLKGREQTKRERESMILSRSKLEDKRENTVTGGELSVMEEKL